MIFSNIFKEKKHDAREHKFEKKLINKTKKKCCLRPDIVCLGYDDSVSLQEVNDSGKLKGFYLKKDEQNSFDGKINVIHFYTDVQLNKLVYTIPYKVNYYKTICLNCKTKVGLRNFIEYLKLSIEEAKKNIVLDKKIERILKEYRKKEEWQERKREFAIELYKK